MLWRKKDITKIEDFFVKKNVRELKRLFSNVPAWYIDAEYALYFFTLVAFLGTFDNPELHSSIGQEFQKFLDKCEKMTGAALGDEEDKKAMLKDFPEADINSWLN